MLTKDNTGLIIVDIQGKLATLVDESEQLIANTIKLIKGAQALDLPIIWLEQNPERLGPTVEGIRELLDDIQPIPKFTFSGCSESAFNEAVSEANVDSWLICGIETHICVYQTAKTLKIEGFNVELVSDCCSSRKPENKQLALSKLQAEGVGITGLEMCLYELVEDSRSPAFKEILGLIK
ncbi:hydrolase [Vibrio sp. T187]|uniref:hydrolase n=1 Tax=Vibrio TaxID=662 RepID=UPI0010CA06A6|nr:MULTISPECIES: hydrolase [Vibrio]MBW3696695.1 hydrolase [Vibrio sp. T187]